MSVKNLSKPLTCPMCQQCKRWGEMVKHVAYAGDLKHKQWRISHKLPAIITFGHHNRYKQNLRSAVFSEFSQ